MASAWAESGINWDDLSRTSIRDAVRELYIAVSERDFWVRHFGSGGYSSIDDLNPIDYDATERRRTKDQVDFIVGSLSRWLSNPPAYSNVTDDDTYKGGYRGCFVDVDNGSKYEYVNYGKQSDFVGEYFAGNMFNNQSNVESLQLGYKSFNKDELGSLELKVGVDLSFIRSYDLGVSYRFNYEMMQDIFKLLNYFTYTRRCTWNSSFGGFSKRSKFRVFITHQGDWRTNGSFDERRESFYNAGAGMSYDSSTSNHYYRVSGSGILTDDEFWEMGSVGFGSSSYSEYFEYKTYQGDLFKTDDFDHISLIYNLTFNDFVGGRVIGESDFFLPNRPKGHTVRKNPFVNLVKSDDGLDLNPDPEGVWVENDFGIIKNGDIPDYIENLPPNPLYDSVRGYFVEQNMPLINFNKEGFLKYYTEEAN